jgi:hypothetical protein
MAISDFYTALSGSVSVSATSSTALMSVYGTAAKRSWVTGVRVKVGVTAAVAGNTLLFQLARPSATNTGTGLASASAHDFSSPASISQMALAWSTAPIVGTILAQWELPQTSGSMWEEFPPTGDEWGIPAVANANANAGLHLFVTPSVVTATPVFVDMIFSE